MLSATHHDRLYIFINFRHVCDFFTTPSRRDFALDLNVRFGRNSPRAFVDVFSGVSVDLQTCKQYLKFFIIPGGAIFLNFCGTNLLGGSRFLGCDNCCKIGFSSSNRVRRVVTNLLTRLCRDVLLDHTIVLAVPFDGHFERCPLRWVPVRFPLHSCLLCLAQFLNLEDLLCLCGFACPSNHFCIGTSLLDIVVLLLQSPLLELILLKVLKLRLLLNLGCSDDHFRLLRLFHDCRLRLTSLCWCSLLGVQIVAVNHLHHCVLDLLLQHDQLLR